jgi:uncharacterized protein (TIGR02996 family)
VSIPEEVRQLDAVFFQDVVANPADDTPLLIYADWLSDQPDLASQTRGEYLRLVTLAGRTRDQHEKRDLAWQAREMWWAHVESWLGPLYDLVDHFIYERGRLCLEISQYFSLGSSPEAIAQMPAWDWVTDIVIRKGNLDVLMHLGQTVRPPQLVSVDIGRNTLEEGELEYLLEAGFWPHIHELGMSQNRLGDAGASELSCWSGLAGIRKLDLELCGIGPHGAESLVGSPYLSGIERLTLSVGYLDAESCRRLRERFRKRVRLE